jgi:23S rRNA (guanosine2251-2'-O)-methyltransferase
MVQGEGASMDGEKDFNYLFGIHPVLEKLKASPREIEEILIAKGHQRPALRSIDAEARNSGLPIRYLDSGLLDRLVGGGRHQGIVAKVASYSYALFADLLEDLSSSPGHDWILVLDGVTDPRNFGALLRTAEGVGVRDVVIPRDRSVGVTPVVAKASAGAVHHLKICRVTNLRQAIAALKKKGYWVLALDPRAEETVYGRGYPEKLVVILGSEGTGIRPLIQRECDFLVSIPLRGSIGSLNVSVAGGIFLYELLRQREASKCK